MLDTVLVKSDMDWIAVCLSLRIAFASTALLVPFGVLLAWPIVCGCNRYRIILETITSVSLVLPPTVIGFYLMVLMGPRSVIGMTLDSLVGVRLLFTFQGLLLTQMLVNLPFLLQPLATSLDSVDRRLLEAASTLGSGKAGIYFRVALPMAWRGLLSGVILSFTHAIGEFGVVLMIGGDLPGKTRTASIALFDQVQTLDFKGANQTALLLLAIAFVGTVCNAWIRSKERLWT